MSENVLSEILGQAARNYVHFDDLIGKTANLMVANISQIPCFKNAALVGEIGKDRNAVAEIYFNGNEQEGVTGWFKTSFYSDATAKTIHSTKSPDGGAEVRTSGLINFSYGGMRESEIFQEVLLQVASIDPHGFGLYLRQFSAENSPGPGI